MRKLYESDSYIVYRGFNKKIIDEHLRIVNYKKYYVYMILRKIYYVMN